MCASSHRLCDYVNSFVWAGGGGERRGRKKKSEGWKKCPPPPTPPCGAQRPNSVLFLSVLALSFSVLTGEQSEQLSVGCDQNDLG